MTERPDQPSDAEEKRGEWHEPDAPNLWQPTKQDTQAGSIWRKVDALPEEMSQVPDVKGGWHLPNPEDTLFNAGDQIEIGDKSQTPTTGSTPIVQRPEDIIMELTGQRIEQPAQAARPEDFDFGIHEPPIEEDDTQPEDAVDEDETLMLDDETGLGELEALGALDDGDDSEAFSMGEWAALATLAAQENELPDNVSRSDLSPAERALFQSASEADRELPLAQGDDSGDNTQTLSDTGQQEAAGDSGNAAYYAARLQEIADTNQQGDFATSEYEPTDSYEPGGYQPESLTLTPQQQQLAAQFRETRRQVGVLRQQYEQGQIDYQQLQTALQNASILDPQENWWMLGYESDQWFRFDKVSGQWEAAEPPVPLDAPSPATMTGTGEMPEVLPGGSLPVLPEDGGTIDIDEFTQDYDNSQYSQAQQDYSNQFGVQEGYTPIPNPDQPAYDPNLTAVGGSAYTDNLSPNTADPTVQNVNMVEGYDPQQTMQSASFGDEPTIGSMVTQPGNAQAGGQQYDAAGAPIYDLESDEAPPSFTEGREQQGDRLLTYIGFAVGGLVILAAIGAAIGFFVVMNWYESQVAEYRDEIAALANYQPDFQVARVLDASGNEIMELTSQDGAREPVTIEAGEVSPFFVHAVVSSEDPTFYENTGIAFWSILRAFVQNLQAGEIESGASTITQQIASNLVLQNREQTAERKAIELAVAIEIANTYSKNEILDIYINEFPFGNQTFGVEAASQLYFDIPAADLNMAQAAMIAGLLPQPGSWNPIADREAAFEAMDVVIGRMINVGCLNFQHGQWVNGSSFCINPNTVYDGQALFTIDPDSSEGYTGPLLLQRTQVAIGNYATRDSEFQYPHFRNFIVERIESAFSPNALYQRGFTIHTTLMPDLQEQAELELINGIRDYNLNGVNTGAIIVIDPRTGAIRAMVGSPDFNNEAIAGQVNNTLTWQQPGSAIKPVVYSAALTGTTNGYLTPASILWDVPSTYSSGYSPVNYDGRFRGPVSVRTALAQSLNVPAVKAFEFIGPEAFAATGRTMGLGFLEETTFGLASALGSNEVRLIDMAEAYGTLATDGVFHQAFAITRITENVDGREVDVDLSETNLGQQEARQAIEPAVAYLMQSMLSDDNARAPQFGQNGPLSGASFLLPNQNYVAAKTGTSNGARDMWTMGFTNNWVVGVWVGTVENTATTGDLTGHRVAAPIWNGVMRYALGLTGANPGAFDPPGGGVVVEETICPLTGSLAPTATDCPQPRVTERFAANRRPPANGLVQNISVDTWTGLRANDWCTNYVETLTFSNINDPFAVTWLNNTPGGQQILNSLGLAGGLRTPPNGQCQERQPIPSVELNRPATGTEVTVSGSYQITGQVVADTLQRWELTYAPVGSEQWATIATGTSQLTQGNSVLADWNTVDVQNNTYRLRLAAYSTTNNGFIFREATVRIDNIVPTSTPLPTQPPPTTTPFGVQSDTLLPPTDTATPNSGL